MRTDFLCIAIVALTWGGYPLIARSSGVGGPLGALVLTLCALVPLSVVTLLQAAIHRPSGPELGKLATAGVLMGIGTAAFNYVVNSRRIDASVSIPLIDMAMVIVGVFGAAFFFGEPLTAKKLVGLGLLIGGMVVLAPA